MMCLGLMQVGSLFKVQLALDIGMSSMMSIAQHWIREGRGKHQAQLADGTASNLNIITGFLSYILCSQA